MTTQQLAVVLHCILDLQREILSRVTFPGFKDISADWQDRTRKLFGNAQVALEFLGKIANPTQSPTIVTPDGAVARAPDLKVAPPDENPDESPDASPQPEPPPTEPAEPANVEQDDLVEDIAEGVQPIRAKLSRET